jgi:DNA (cytosine-5)-methyltransferase 1
MGYSRAGFTDIVGVDLADPPRYPFEFVRGDALKFVALHGHQFDAIHASPPCQAHSMFSRNMGTAHRHIDLIQPTREALQRLNVPSVIENVEGAPLEKPFRLCGSSFGLLVQRHRLFESHRFDVGLTPPCAHDSSRLTVPVYGHGSPQWHRKKWGRNVRLDEKKSAMGIDWMTGWSLSQAIPPAYTEFIGRQLMSQITEDR